MFQINTDNDVFECKNNDGEKYIMKIIKSKILLW